MDQDMIATHLENIDQRLARVEQILPTLATKEELKTLATREELKTLATKEELKTLATKEELKTLATKAELRAAIADAVAPLATKAELQAAIAPLATKDEILELRRHMEVLSESQRADIQLLAEHLASVMPKQPER